MWPENFDYLTAFDDLSAQSRPVGMGVGNIPVTEILAYGRAFGFEDLDELLTRIRAADQVFMEWNAARKPGADKGTDDAAEVAGKLGITLTEDSLHGQSEDVIGRGGPA